MTEKIVRYRTRIRKNGNSLIITIHNAFVQGLSLEQGQEIIQEVDFGADEVCIKLYPAE